MKALYVDGKIATSEEASGRSDDVSERLKPIVGSRLCGIAAGTTALLSANETETEDESGEETDNGSERHSAFARESRRSLHSNGRKKGKRLSRLRNEAVSPSHSSTDWSGEKEDSSELSPSGVKSELSDSDESLDVTERERRRTLALEELQNLERQFTSVRSKLFEERMGSLSEEILLLQEGMCPKLRDEFARVETEFKAVASVLQARKECMVLDANKVQLVVGRQAEHTFIFNRAQWRLKRFDALRRRKFQLRQDCRRLEDKAFFQFLFRSNHDLGRNPHAALPPAVDEEQLTCGNTQRLSAAVFRQVVHEPGSPFLYSNPNRQVNHGMFPMRPFRPVSKRLPEALAVVSSGGFPAAALNPTSRSDILEDLEALQLWKGPLVPLSQHQAYHMEAVKEQVPDHITDSSSIKVENKTMSLQNLLLQRPPGKQKRGRKPLAYHQAMQALSSSSKNT